jgi:hypothetical protein
VQLKVDACVGEDVRPLALGGVRVHRHGGGPARDHARHLNKRVDRRPRRDRDPARPADRRGDPADSLHELVATQPLTAHLDRRPALRQGRQEQTGPSHPGAS